MIQRAAMSPRTREIPTTDRIISLMLAFLGMGIILCAIVSATPIILRSGWDSPRAVVFLLSAAGAFYAGVCALHYAFRGVRLR